jgi:NitT/TauT family transport system permease protein
MSRQLLYAAMAIGLFIFLWEIVSIASGLFYLSTKPFLPSASSVLYELLLIIKGETPIGESSYIHILHTLKRLLSGVLLGAVIGVAVGIIMGLRDKAEDFFESWNWIFATIPAVMWSYIFILVIGVGDATTILVLAAVTYPQMAFRVARGMKAIRVELVEMARSFNTSMGLLIREVYIPQLLPYIFGGVRYSLAIGVQIIAIAELVGLTSGIGMLLNYWWDARKMAPLLAWGAMLVFLGLFFEFVAFRSLERRLFKWVR